MRTMRRWIVMLVAAVALVCAGSAFAHTLPCAIPGCSGGGGGSFTPDADPGEDHSGFDAAVVALSLGAQETIASDLAEMEACVEAPWRTGNKRTRICRLSTDVGIDITAAQFWRIEPTSATSEPDTYDSRTLIIDFGGARMQASGLGDDVAILTISTGDTESEQDVNTRIVVQNGALYGDPTASGEAGLFLTEGTINDKGAYYLKDFVIGSVGLNDFGQAGDTPLVGNKTLGTDLYVVDSRITGLGGNNDAGGVTPQEDAWPRENKCGGGIVCLGNESGEGTLETVFTRTKIIGTDPSAANPCVVVGTNVQMDPLYTVNCSGIVQYTRGYRSTHMGGDLYLNFDNGETTPQRAITYAATAVSGLFGSANVRVFVSGDDTPVTLLHLGDSILGSDNDYYPRSFKAVAVLENGSGTLLTADPDASAITMDSLDLQVFYSGVNAQGFSVLLESHLYSDDFQSRVAAGGTLNGQVRTPVGNYTFLNGVAFSGLGLGKDRRQTVFTDLPDGGGAVGAFSRDVRFDVLSAECESDESPPGTIELSVGGSAISPQIPCEGDYSTSDELYDCTGGDCTGCPAGICAKTMNGPVLELPSDPNGRIVCDGGTPNTHFEVDPPGDDALTECHVGSRVNIAAGSFKCFIQNDTQAGATISVDFDTDPTGSIGCAYVGNVNRQVDVSGDADGKGVAPSDTVDIECVAGCDGAGSDDMTIFVTTEGS